MVRVHSLVHGLLSIPTMVLSALHCKCLREGASPDSKSISQFSSEWIKPDTQIIAWREFCFSTCYFGHVDTSLLRTTLFSIKITSYITYIFVDYYGAIALEPFFFFLPIWHRNRIFVITNVLTSSTLRIFCEFFLSFG